MTYKVKIDYSPIYEMVISLYIFMDNKVVKNIELGEEWYKKAEERLDPEFTTFIKNTKESSCYFSYLYLLIWQSPEKSSYQAFIDWLQKLTTGELYEYLSPHVIGPLPNVLGNIRDQYCYLLKNWFEQYYQYVDSTITEEIERTYSKAAQEKVGDPIAFVERVSGGVRIPAYEGLDHVILIPTYHQSPMITYHQHQSFYLVFYSIDLPIQDPHAPAKALVRLTKALSDENRLKILKQLTSGPKSFTNLLQEINVSKSTVYHHIMTLRAAGLISVLVSQDCGYDSYVLRQTAVVELNKHLKDFLEIT